MTILFSILFMLNAISLQSDVSVESTVQWMTWDEAVAASKESPKKILVDVYTDWCGYCKKMDKGTFTDVDLAKYINENFYAVKLDAEHKEDIIWNDVTFKFLPKGRKGAHELAISLLDGKMGYPSFVYLDESFSRIMISPGYKTAPMMQNELIYAVDEHYKNKTWADYKAELKGE